MSCRYCGTALPDDALFCGECGRAVYVDLDRVASTASSSVIVSNVRSTRAVAVSPTVAPVEAHDHGHDADADADENDDSDEDWDAPPVVGFSIADLAFSSPGDVWSPDDHHPKLPEDPDDDGVDHGSVPGIGELPVVARCPQCGEPMADGDVFCGECGFVVRIASPVLEDSGSPATSVILLPELIHIPTSDATTEVEPVEFVDSPADESVVAAEPSEAPAHRLQPFELPIAKPAPTTRSRPIPDPFPWGSDSPLRDDVEATRIIGETPSGSRFVLQFSTGESVTVTGSGLIGRNPTMQPGEYVDQLVPVFDAGKSVSKTHLEFGQEAGRFWVSDRYSTNGSVIRQPELPPRRCDAGRRYFVARGTRVDVGEQFFVVS